jgi:hypothetical protein
MERRKWEEYDGLLSIVAKTAREGAAGETTNPANLTNQAAADDAIDHQPSFV